MRTLIPLFLLAVTAPALAFGPLGHEVVAEVAARALDQATRARVEALFSQDASDALRDGSTWVHEVPELEGYGATGPLHYVNFPRGICRYDAARDCRNGRCVVVAIDHFAAKLRAGGSPAAEREAVKWLVHMVADVHQPLHAAWGDDRGGNTVQLRFRGEGTNLHKLWDSDLIRTRGLRAGRYADALLAAAAQPVASAWREGAAARWAEESCAIARDALYPTPRRIDEAYLLRSLPLLDRRMLEAGLRLAAVLQASLHAP